MQLSEEEKKLRVAESVFVGYETSSHTPFLNILTLMKSKEPDNWSCPAIYYCFSSSLYINVHCWKRQKSPDVHFPPSNAPGASEPHRGTGSTIQPLSGEVVYSKGTESHISLQHGAPLHSPNHKGGQVECDCLQKKLQRATNSQSLDIWTLKKERDSNHDGRWQSRRNRALLKGNVNYVAAACWTKNTGGL